MFIFAIIVFRLSKLPVEKGNPFRTGPSEVIFFPLVVFTLAFLFWCRFKCPFSLLELVNLFPYNFVKNSNYSGVTVNKFCINFCFELPSQS